MLVVMAMKKYKLVIFDMDGTIADTSPGIFNSIRYTEEKMGLPEITLEQMYSHVGPPMEESYNRNFGLTGERLKQAVGYHKEYAIKKGFKELTLYDGIIQLIDDLRSNGIKTAVATLKAHDTILKIFESLNISDKFDMVIGVSPEKPLTKSELLDCCIEELGEKKSEAVLIGDSKYDAVGAMQSGIDFIAVTYGFGFTTKEDADEYANVCVCDSVEKLNSFLLNDI